MSFLFYRANLRARLNPQNTRRTTRKQPERERGSEGERVRNREQIAPASFLLSVVRTHKCWVRLSRLRWRRLCLWKCAHARAQAPARTPRRFILRRSERGSRKYCTIRRDARGGGWLRPPCARWSCCLAAAAAINLVAPGVTRERQCRLMQSDSRAGLPPGGTEINWLGVVHTIIASRVACDCPPQKKNTHTHTARDGAQVCVCFDRFFVCVCRCSRVCDSCVCSQARSLRCWPALLRSALELAGCSCVHVCVEHTHTHSHTRRYLRVAACPYVDVLALMTTTTTTSYDGSIHAVSALSARFIMGLVERARARAAARDYIVV